jgi:hypothetical protein
MHMHITKAGKNSEIGGIEHGKRSGHSITGNTGRNVHGTGNHLSLHGLSHGLLLSVNRKKCPAESGKTNVGDGRGTELSGFGLPHLSLRL